MGLTVQDLTLLNGAHMPNAYISLRHCNIHCMKTDTSNSWLISSVYGVYSSNIAPKPVEHRQFNMNVVSGDFSQPFFQMVYTRLKTQFSNVSDC